ncbi:MAG TPA: adenylate/guanylate cyclase domain-containing protein [Mycobacteriales bacterium]|nr:adenylate/guanylate cyclase domain-containing protein [Mycobacteriales bacterium]
MTRATVGLLFSDIEGSTRLLQQLGPDYAAVLLEHRRLLRAAYLDHGGTEQGTEGDSFFVTFATAADAVAAALAGQLALAGHDWPTDVAVRVRMGVHVGSVEQLADTLVGMAVHEAARIAAAAHGGQVLVSDPAARLATPLPPGAGWRDLGGHRLKDLAAVVQLHQLTHPDLVGEFPPVRSQGSSRSNLPAQPTSFIGRVREVAEVERLLADARLVTVTGTGGAGKSRIALRVAAEAASRYTDGAWFVDLARVSDPGAVGGAFAAALGQPDLATSELVTTLGDRQLLLLVDNCEHVIAAVSDVVTDLVLRCPEVAVLATSREPLGVAGEVVWRVPPLTREDALELLGTRGRAVNAGFALTDANRQAAEVLCDRLDAIPLAVELAAARLTSLSVEQLSSRLDQRFRLLAGGARGGMERHRTLQATVDWSYGLLDPTAQALLRRLGVFAGGFTLDAAEAVCTDLDALTVVDTIDQLVVKSLVIAEPHDAEVHYRLLETIRQYAVDRLVQADELVATRDAHLRWVQGLVAGAEPTLWLRDDDPGCRARLDANEGNIRAALEWAADREQFDTAAGIVFGILSWLIGRNRSRDGLEWSQRLLAAGVAGESRALLAVAQLFYASNLAPIDRDMVEQVRDSLPLLTGTARAWLQPVAEAAVAAWSYPPGDRDAAERAIAVCERTLAQAGGSTHLSLLILQPLIWVNLDAGHLEAGRRWADEGVAIAVAAADGGLFESRMTLNRARIAQAMGDLDAAWVDAERSMRTARATGEPFVANAAARLLAQVADARGEYDRARDVLASVLDTLADFAPAAEVAAVHEQLARYAELAAAR